MSRCGRCVFLGVFLMAGCDGPGPTDGGPDDAGTSVDSGPSEVCGDGIISASEVCDDGNEDDADGCSGACEVEDGFTCDREPSACAGICGDGLVRGAEGCDDGNDLDGDGCGAACAAEPGYACDGEPSACATVCGDGVDAGDEACDDGNDVAGDGCSDTCTVEEGVMCAGTPSVCTATCGDGVVATIEECDDANVDQLDGCSEICTVERGFSCAGSPSVCMTGCGDGIVAGTEGCDDGAMVDADGCDASCQPELGYACSGEPSACASVCGDGIIAGAEGCDDSDVTAGDGCSDTCTEEMGFACEGAPSVCGPRCGDGMIVSTETCDDGNRVAGDGCSSVCAGEFGFSCTGAPSTCPLTETLAQVALGGYGGCVRTVSGSVACFGDNTESEVGNGTDNIETFLPADTGIRDASVVVAGDEHHCAIRSGGTVWCWGDNIQLQQGVVGSTLDQPVPQMIAALSGVVFLAAGDDHNCVIDGAGAVFCWGDSDNRQLGQGTSTTDSATPLAVALPGTMTATQLSLGQNHSCALLADATVACWGDDDNGQLGDGASGTDSGVAAVVPGLTDVAQVEAGVNNTCARTSAGALFCWGDNIDGQIGDGATTDRASPVAVTLPAPVSDVTVAADFVCALLTNDEVYCWGESTDYETGVGVNTDVVTPTLVRGLAGLTLTDVEAGSRNVCVTTSSNTRLCWGHSEEGQVGIAPLNRLALGDPIAYGGTVTQLEVAPPEYRSPVCAVLSDGTVSCHGSGNTVTTTTAAPGSVGVFIDFQEHLAEPTPIPSLTGVLEMALGDGFACARHAAEVRCWGDNLNRNLGQGGTSTADSATPLPVMSLAVVDEIEAGAQFACARGGGTVRCWGDNDNRQSGEASTTTDQSVPIVLAGLGNAVDIELGQDFGCALRGTGDVSCWGDNFVGQLGTGAAGTDSAVPTIVIGLPAAAEQIVVGQDHACALVAGEAYCWGENGRGQLGRGDTTDSATPMAVPGISGATALSSGYNFTCAILAGGAVSCWGYGLDGHFGNGGSEWTGESDFLSPVASPGFTGVLEIVSGNAMNCFRSAAGWRCLGFRDSGQLGDGTALRASRPVPAMVL